NYQKMITAFNVLFNAKAELKKGEQALSAARHTDYTKPLQLLPYEPKLQPDARSGNAAAVAGADHFAAAEAKAQRAIAEHSIYIKGQEHNALIDDAYMVLGKARYFQNKPIAALEAFDHIKMFIQQGDQLIDAWVWSGNAHLLAGNEYAALDAANSVLSRRAKAKKAQLEAAYKLTAAVFIEQAQWQKAIEAIQAAKGYAKKVNRIRYTYLQAQLYALMGQTHLSAEAFRTVIDMRPDKTTAVFATLHIASHAEKGNERPFEKALQRFVKSKRYDGYRADIYYRLGRLAERAKDTQAALSAYRKAVRAQAFYKASQGLAYVRLMRFAFEAGRFSESCRYRDSALAMLPPDRTIAKDLQQQPWEQLLHWYHIRVRDDSLLSLTALGTKKGKDMNGQAITGMKGQNDWYFHKPLASGKGLKALKPGGDMDPGIDLSQMPTNQGRKDSLKAERDSASLHLGELFRVAFSKPRSAISELTNLLNRGPDSSLKPKIYYNLYKSYATLSDFIRAKKYRDLAIASQSKHLAQFEPQKPVAYTKLLDSSTARFADMEAAARAEALKGAAEKILHKSHDDQ
ncbi:MAG: hypothetical protein V6Z82_02425, partial [Flavobacteriales bacterium]